MIVNETHFALKLLEEEGFIQLSENFNDPARIHFEVDNRQLYDFQIRYPEFDSFIKLMLRLYGGELFTEYVRISETELGQIYFAPESEIVKKLSFLKERGIIDYEPRRDKPQLTFLTPRFDAAQLPLNVFEIERRRERDRQKARAVIQYASNKNRCRTLLLLEYFNEMDGHDCGVCDVCIRKKKNEANAGINEELGNKILLYLKDNGSVTPRFLSQVFENIAEPLFLQTLKYLIEEEIVQYDNVGKLNLNSKYHS